MLADPKKLAQMRRERSVVIIKPDAVIRKLTGELIQRFERKGLKIIALKMVIPTKAIAEKHYTDSEEWLLGSGTTTFNSYAEQGVTPIMTAREFGLNTRRKLMDHLTGGPVVTMILEGAHVIETVRIMRGATSPLKAQPGTIGFDYSLESYDLSDAGDWAIKNIIHASDSVENATREIKIWFKPTEIVEYKSAEEDILYSKDWYGRK